MMVRRWPVLSDVYFPIYRQKQEGGGWTIAPPKPLFYERGDTEWDDVIEELPVEILKCQLSESSNRPLPRV